MSKETETPTPDTEETPDASDAPEEQDEEQGKPISIRDESPMTVIWLQQAIRHLEREHMGWVSEGPQKTGFDPRVIEIRIMKNLLIDKRANFDEISRQIREMYGDNVTRKALDDAWKKICDMVETWKS